jgi:membrane protein YdbS with pleckstrin-like domain
MEQSLAETKELVFHPSIFAFVDGMLLAALCFFLFIVILCTPDFPLILAIAFALVLAVVGGISLIVLFFRSRAFTFKVSAEKIVVEYHFFIIRVEELPLEAVVRVVTDQTILGRIMKIGNVMVFSPSGYRGLTLFGLKNFNAVKDEILKRRDLRIHEITAKK